MIVLCVALTYLDVDAKSQDDQSGKFYYNYNLCL